MIACRGQFLTSMLWRYLIPVYCITLPAVKKGLGFCCIDWTKYTPALTSSTGAAKRANLASSIYESADRKSVV